MRAGIHRWKTTGKKDFMDKTFLFNRQKTTAAAAKKKKKSTYLFFAEGNERTFKIPSFNWFDLDII